MYKRGLKEVFFGVGLKKVRVLEVGEPIIAL